MILLVVHVDKVFDFFAIYKKNFTRGCTWQLFFPRISPSSLSPSFSSYAPISKKKGLRLGIEEYLHLFLLPKSKIKSLLFPQFFFSSSPSAEVRRIRWGKFLGVCQIDLFIATNFLSFYPLEARAQDWITKKHDTANTVHILHLPFLPLSLSLFISLLLPLSLYLPPSYPLSLSLFLFALSLFKRPLEKWLSVFLLFSRVKNSAMKLMLTLLSNRQNWNVFYLVWTSESSFLIVYL